LFKENTNTVFIRARDIPGWSEEGFSIIFQREQGTELVEVIESYRLGRVPLVVPLTLLRHHFRRYPNSYIEQQVYLNPHPPELMLRNLI
jgi:uncharacterized protein YbgA (DUF1722 family)